MQTRHICVKKEESITWVLTEYIQKEQTHKGFYQICIKRG